MRFYIGARMFQLGTPTDVHGNTYLAYSMPHEHVSVAITKEQGKRFAVDGYVDKATFNRLVENMPNENEVGEDSIIADEAYIPEDEWDDVPTTPRFKDSNIGENNLD